MGYWGGEYHKYAPIDGHYVWKETRRRHWFGLTEAEISLVWLLGRGNYNEKKEAGSDTDTLLSGVHIFMDGTDGL